MSPPLENETVFVLASDGVVAEARVTARTIQHKTFACTLVHRSGFCVRDIASEGITWCRPEHEASFRVTVALS